MSKLTIIGYDVAIHYQRPDEMIDFAFMTEDDYGFNSVLAADDTFEFALPYAAGININSEAMVLHWIDFIFQGERRLDVDNLVQYSLDITMSFLDVDFDTTNQGSTLDDTNQVEYKKTFDGPYRFALTSVLLEHFVDVGAPANERAMALIYVDGNSLLADQILRWVPLFKLDLALPLFLQFINASTLHTAEDLSTLATPAALVQSIQDSVAMRVFFTKRRLTKEERGIREVAKRFMNLNA